MSKKNLIIILSSLFLFVLNAFIVFASDDKVYKLRYGVVSDETAGHIGYNPITNHFKDMVYQMSQGRLIIETQVDLVPDTEIAMAVIDGRLDMGNFMVNWSSGTFPTWDYTLPFLFKDNWQYEKLTQDPEFISVMRKSYADKGLYYFGENNVGGNDTIWSNKPIETINDLKNLKIRTGGLMPTIAFKELGAAPITMTFSELAEAMNRGTIDAVISDIVWAPHVGMMDVAEYICYWPVNRVGGGAQVMNLEKWNSLPSDLQKVLSDAIWIMIKQDNWALFNVQLQNKKTLAMTKKVFVPEQATINQAAETVKQITKEKYLKLADKYGPEIMELVEKYTK